MIKWIKKKKWKSDYIWKVDTDVLKMKEHLVNDEEAINIRLRDLENINNHRLGYTSLLDKWGLQFYGI